MTRIALTAVSLALAAGVPASHARADELIVTGMSGLIQTIDLDTGSVGHLGVCTGAVRSMAVADGVLYLGGLQDDLWVFDLAAGQVVRSFQLPGEAHAMAWDGVHLLVANTDSTIAAIDPADGSVVETRQVPTSDISAIGIDAGGLFVGGENSLALRSHLGGDQFDFFAACGSMIQAMAFGPDTMYLAGTAFFGNDTGTVYKFDKFVGGVNYTDSFDVPNNPTAALEHAGLLYVGGTDGMVHEIDPADGTILRSFDLFIEVSGIAPTTGLISCPADYDVSGDLNFFDIAQFIDLLGAELPAGDANGDGAHDFFDVQAFLDLYNAGCP
jgi:YD repeat-containing protein